MLKLVRTILSVSVLLGARALSADPTYVVNSTDDAHDAAPGDGVCETKTPGVCTLRAAVEEAMAGAGGTVQLPAGAYPLIYGELTVQKSLKILGAGASKTEISPT